MIGSPGFGSRGSNGEGRRGRRRAAWWGLGAALAVAAVVFARGPVLHAMASVLIVQDPLEPAAVIVVLGGHFPIRALEAAELYRAGWAPRVVVTKGPPGDAADELLKLGIEPPAEWRLNRQVLQRMGVPPAAVVVTEAGVSGTLEELRSVFRSIRPGRSPAILVTSKVHTRRVRLTWSYLTEGRSRPIVRAARRDPFELARWWSQRRFALAVVREYLGLLNYLAGFPVGASAGVSLKARDSGCPRPNDSGIGGRDAAARCPRVDSKGTAEDVGMSPQVSRALR